MARQKEPVFKEFKEFAMRGNVVDLAVGIMLGAAFNKIVNSLVNDIMMPPIGLMLGNVDFSNLFFNLSETPYASLAEAQAAGAATVNYGLFLNTILEFTLISFALFIIVRQINRLNREKAEAPSIPPAATKQEVLLTEIRDLLKTRP